MTREEARCMVFDLLDAARAYDLADTGFRRDAREHYEEMRAKVIAALLHEPEPRTAAGSLD